MPDFVVAGSCICAVVCPCPCVCACACACASEMGNWRCTAKAEWPQVGVVPMELSCPRGIWNVDSEPLTSEGLPFNGCALTCTVVELRTEKLINILEIVG